MYLLESSLTRSTTYESHSYVQMIAAMSSTCWSFREHTIFIRITALNKPLAKEFLIDIVRLLDEYH